MMIDLVKEYFLTAALGLLVTFLTGWVVSLKKKLKATQDGVRSLLRADIIRSFEKYEEKGYCPIYARDALDKEYKAYKDLDGNGVIDDIYEKIKALPVK